VRCNLSGAENLDVEVDGEMKKRILLGVMVLFCAIPVIAWARTVNAGLPLGAYSYDLGRLLALVGFVLLFFQFVFSAKIKWIERDIGHDRLIAIHRTSGVVGLVLILIHPAFLFLYDVLSGFGPTFGTGKLIGFVSLALFVLAAGSALLFRRLRLKYETWKAIHWLSYVALPIGFVHSLWIGSDLYTQPLRAFWLLMAAFYVAIVLYKVWNILQVRRRPYRVAEVVPETHDTWTLRFDGPRLGYKPGQFLLVQLERNGRVLESHPFTIASSPTQDKLAISVKAVGDFTATIGQTKPGDRAYIDAPYGVFSFLNHDADDLVFIAGGIGITPFLSMLRYLRDTGLNRRVLLMWGNKTEADIIARGEIDAMCAAMSSLRVIHVMSNQDDWPGEKGFVTAQRLAKYLNGVTAPQVFVCGPPVMMDKVIPSLVSLGIPKQRIHDERFAL